MVCKEGCATKFRARRHVAWAALAGLAIVAMLSGRVADARELPATSLFRVAGGDLRMGVDAAGSLRELTHLPDGDNRLAGDQVPLPLWEIDVANGGKTISLSPTQAEPPRIESRSTKPPGLKIVWGSVPLSEKQSLRVEAEVWLDEQGSHWTLRVRKPKDVRLESVRFPRVAALKPREHEVLAVPEIMGRLVDDPRRMLEGCNQHRRDWAYPWTLSMQCLAYYKPNGPGFYAACDDTQAYCKKFSLWSDSHKQVCFELCHAPEGGAAGASEFRLPFAVVLNAFRGDWTTVAEHYRRSPTARAWSEQGRLCRELTPEWLNKTGLWVWNRGRSKDVLPPAVALQRRVQAPVSVYWHWWHGCAYDAGFPEYLPPREGTDAFRDALASAHREGLHAMLYVNQRLWGTTTTSWRREGANRYAAKTPQGQVLTESYNQFMHAPCAVMCIGTDFWRNKCATLAQEAIDELGADGVYLDQTGVSAVCFDPDHGHVVGPGRYWFSGLDQLTASIRKRCCQRGPIALGGEFCAEAILPDLDAVLSLDVSTGPNVIPFFQAVYHPSVVTYGSYATLVYPPYDERWPADKKPADRLTLLDRKFSAQFYLAQAKAFVWGMQPTIPNVTTELLEKRPEEIDYLARLVRTRQRALKYLLHGTWLRPPTLDVPQQQIDVAALGPYTVKLRPSKRSCPTLMAGAWRAADGNVAVALAGIHADPLTVRLPIDFQAYGLPRRCAVHKIDASGRRRLGAIESSRPELRLDLPPRAICVLELCRDD